MQVLLESSFLQLSSCDKELKFTTKSYTYSFYDVVKMQKDCNFLKMSSGPIIYGYQLWDKMFFKVLSRFIAFQIQYYVQRPQSF